MPALLFLFILWIIFEADGGKDNYFINLADTVPFGDKLGHTALYGVLALAMNRALRMKTLKVGKWKIFLGALIVLSFALLEEMTQLAFATRTFDLLDIAGDIIGVAAFSSLSFRWNKA